LLALFKLIFAILAEKNTRKTNKNANIPSSPNIKDESALDLLESKGKNKPEVKRSIKNSLCVYTIKVAVVNTCHVCCDITLRRLHRCRGKEAIDKMDIISQYHCIVVHHHWACYLSYDHFRQALGEFHSRRLLSTQMVHTWAKNIKRLLGEACRFVSNIVTKRLTEADYKHLQEHY